MTMQHTTTTRMELIAKRSQLQLAVQGRELIEQKRIALVQELLRVVDTVMQETATLQEVAADARHALGVAESVAGSSALRAAAMSVRNEFALKIRNVHLMGVEIPQIEQRGARRSDIGRGYSVTGTSTTIDEAAAAFETLVETIIKHAESEMYLKRLAVEIQRTSRRVNALDTLVIPRIRKEIATIEMALNERERSDNFRLRLAKRLRARKRAKQP